VIRNADDSLGLRDRPQKISKRTIARYRHEKSPEPAPLAPAPNLPPAHAKPVSATKPLDKVVVDITTVPSLFGLVTFHIALVMDVFSRFPLACRCFRSEPSAIQMIELVEEALRFGRIRVLFSDHGAAFTSGLFRTAMRSIGIDDRRGAIGSPRSTALIERLWRTLKETLRLVFVKPLVLLDLERRVGLWLVHYAFHRPHQALHGATPAEVFLRLPPAHLAAVPPPRGRPGEDVDFPGYEVHYLDAERRLPVLRREAA
jgi:transposase InsO family protein